MIMIPIFSAYGLSVFRESSNGADIGNFQLRAIFFSDAVVESSGQHMRFIIKLS